MRRCGEHQSEIRAFPTNEETQLQRRGESHNRAAVSVFLRETYWDKRTKSNKLKVGKQPLAVVRRALDKSTGLPGSESGTKTEGRLNCVIRSELRR